MLPSPKLHKKEAQTIIRAPGVPPLMEPLLLPGCSDLFYCLLLNRSHAGFVSILGFYSSYLKERPRTWKHPTLTISNMYMYTHMPAYMHGYTCSPHSHPLK